VALLDVDMMAGIEYEEFPARIAEVAMWLMDHQMNLKMSMEFGQYFARLPLIKSAKIIHADALETDWESVVSKNELSFILGNPPFIGAKIMNQPQRDAVVNEFEGIQGSGVLDYVTGWYIKAAKYIQGTTIKVAFVSTNSIVQGEQTSILWGQMFNKYNIKIHFAHRTFKWSNEAKGNAAVYCVIVGFANYDTVNKSIFEYEDIKGEAHEIKAKNINPYLVDARDIFITKRNKPICKVPEISRGNMANDDGNLVFFSIQEKNEFVKLEPKAEKYIMKYMGSDDFINNKERFCLWLKDISPTDLKSLPEILKRVYKVQIHRLKSTREATRKFAEYPNIFTEIRQPSTNFLIIPSVSSERRKYIPIGYKTPETIINTDVSFIPNISLFHFGILTSLMHMAWVKSVCGRLESRFRYSNTIVYNNYPWPEHPSDKQKEAIEKAAQKVLDARAEFPTSSLADLYDPLTMPPALVKAHNDLDKAVDLAYRPQAFTSEANRMVFLFELYEKYTANLFTKEKPKKTKKTTA
jgi:hypothetical protein